MDDRTELDPDDATTTRRRVLGMTVPMFVAALTVAAIALAVGIWQLTAPPGSYSVRGEIVIAAPYWAPATNYYSSEPQCAGTGDYDDFKPGAFVSLAVGEIHMPIGSSSGVVQWDGNKVIDGQCHLFWSMQDVPHDLAGGDVLSYRIGVPGRHDYHPFTEQQARSSTLLLTVG